MVYCERADFDVPERKLVQLCDDEALAVGLTTLAEAEAANPEITNRIDNAIARADSRIDSYIRARYAVPLDAPIPATITRLSVDLALYYLHGRRDSEFDVPASIERRYKDALDELEGINRATIDLGIEAPPASSGKAAVVSIVQPEQLCTQGTLGDF